jgi:TolB protein
MPKEFYELREAWLAVPEPSEDVREDARARLFDEVAQEQSGRVGRSSELGRRPKLRFLRGRRPRLRLAIAAALLLLLLSGVATAAYLLLRGDGKIALEGGYGTLLVVNPNGSGLHTIARCTADDGSCAVLEPAWSKDGRQLAFLRGPDWTPYEPGHLSLYVAASAGGGARRLAACGNCGKQYGNHLGWSPDGRWIAFSRDAGPRGQESLSVVAAAGGRPHRLTDCRPAQCVDVQPVWSPDGRLLIFERWTRAGQQQLYTVRPDGSGLTKIADGADPQWSPNGRRIAFDGFEASDRHGGIEVANADGSDAHVLFAGTGATGPGAPSWSPDGRKLVFFKTPGRPRHYRAEVWTMNADGSAKKRLYRSGCCISYWAPPVWSPDGRMIAFSADSAGGTFVINADGSGLRRLSRATSAHLSWQERPRR